MKISYSVITDVGETRSVNQDNYYLNGKIKPIKDTKKTQTGKNISENQNYAVCDGMGGESFGEYAAFFAVDELKNFSAKHMWNSWSDYINKANEAICNYSRKTGSCMGTTYAGLILKKNQYMSINIGDSRVYHIYNHRIEQLSHDHTEFQLLVDNGILKKTAFFQSKLHNRLTQYLGIEPEEFLIEPVVRYGEFMEAGHSFMLCSDGLYSVVNDDTIKNIILSEKNVLSACNKLIETAKINGSKDNITVMIIHVDEINEEDFSGESLPSTEI